MKAIRYVPQRPGSKLIPPHGGRGLACCLLQGDELELEKDKAKTMKKVQVSARAKGDLIMIGIGAFSPLGGFMTRADWKSVCENFTLADGTFWPVPITLDVSSSDGEKISIGDEIALEHGGSVYATMKVTEKYEMTEADKKWECEKIFKGEGEESVDGNFWEIAPDDHPGVIMVMNQKDVNIAGPVKVLSQDNYPDKYKGVYLTPAETRALFEKRGWSDVAALQLSNPMLRSHESLAKIAIEVCDGLLLHSLIGNRKPGDIPDEVRLKTIECLVKNYFVEGTVINAGYPLDTRYAGPREGLLHAIFRQNYGISKMIIGRDHAGVGDFYGLFEAQEIFDAIPTPADQGKALQCKPLKIDWTFYCHKCDGMASLRTCPHTKEDRVIQSGLKLRRALGKGGEMPDHLVRPEVGAILTEYYEKFRD